MKGTRLRRRNMKIKEPLSHDYLEMNLKWLLLNKFSEIPSTSKSTKTK